MLAQTGTRIVRVAACPVDNSNGSRQDPA
ncbi:MAG: hypothetical protein ACI83E_000308, partial [Sulfitobacter sp.]